MSENVQVEAARIPDRDRLLQELREAGLEPIGVFAHAPNGPFLGMPVRAVSSLADEDFDALVLATFDRPEAEIATLAALGIPASKILALRQPERAVAP